MSDKNYDLHSIRKFASKNLVVQLSNQLPDSSNAYRLIYEKLAKDYKAQSDVAFINIYMHLSAEEWLEYMSNHGSEGDFLVELSWNETLTEMFGIKSFPHFVVVGK